MKKFIGLVMAFCIGILACSCLVGCAKKETSFGVSNVKSNGGSAVVVDGYAYYIKGATTSYKALKEEALNNCSIYKCAVDENGNIIDPSTESIVYKGIAGFKNGSLYAFGEYLYFSTPSKKTSNTASTMTDHTSFCRVKLDGSGYKVLYTTETNSAISYEYYSSNDKELYLVVLEGEELYSLDLKNKCKKIELNSEVTSAVFTSTFGQGNNAEGYVFYTKTPEVSYLTQSGVVVYKQKPNGEELESLSSGTNVTLLEIKYGCLFYSVNDIVYKTSTVGGLDKTTPVCYASYDRYYFLEDGAVIASDKDNSLTAYIKWTNYDQYDIYKLMSTSSATFFYDNGNNLYYYDGSNNINKITLTGTLVTGTKVNEDVVQVVGNKLDFDIVGSNLYYFNSVITTDESGAETTTYTTKVVAL